MTNLCSGQEHYSTAESSIPRIVKNEKDKWTPYANDIDMESHFQAENDTRHTMLLLAMLLTRCGIWAQTLSLSRPRLKALFVTRKDHIIRHSLLDMSILVLHEPAEATLPQHPTSAPPILFSISSAFLLGI